ncbi:hypothetical protein CI109_102056 [Kwoniella shandongensis]|uniref:Uncharacterized protein n=1 Tax=Kwoniella shandongensis TaxID=1734106 RepID=A0A5M6BUB2_9TREE|nr:uncharacterized protein CI109_006535 [Kwoniella shandongensis]KAA5525165.1 hypothetical protein CI109_006535 [Kwoniella shandongensis]
MSSDIPRTVDKSFLDSPPDFAPLPPPAVVPELDLDASTPLPEQIGLDTTDKENNARDESEKYVWHEGMTDEEKNGREDWISGARGRKGLRIVIVTENFLPKVDGVTRTLSRLLEHLHASGHKCMLLGPSSTLTHYASHPLVGTLGIPLVVYPGLKLNFLRPKFLRVIKEFQPDVVHFVDPIWLGAQTLLAMELGWAGDEWVGDRGPALGGGLSGGVVASYHTNLATYATLFGLSWLTPIMWRFQRSLYSKALLTLCPSPSTKGMLEFHGFDGVRLWPRGVDISQFGPRRRNMALRATWGVGYAPSEVVQMKDASQVEVEGTNWTGRKTSLPMTPPMTPWTGPVEHVRAGEVGCERQEADQSLPERVVLLFVGRISWEKNISLLLSAYAHLAGILPTGTLMPKLIFVGDGPARADVEARCEKEGWDVECAGFKEGEALAEYFASADVFAFPSFTETFGQVVLEALASGLPVVGLDAEGTRDLVSHGSTGLLLPLDSSESLTWATACQPDSTHFDRLAKGYAELLARVVADAKMRKEMSKRGSTEGIKGYTWWDAMERCVDGYRESIRIARSRRAVQVIQHSPGESSSSSETAQTSAVRPRRISIVNRVVSRRLGPKDLRIRERLHVGTVRGGMSWTRGAGKKITSESGWPKLILKAFIAIFLFYAIYWHHQAKVRSRTAFKLADEIDD